MIIVHCFILTVAILLPHLSALLNTYSSTVQSGSFTSGNPEFKMLPSVAEDNNLKFPQNCFIAYLLKNILRITDIFDVNRKSTQRLLSFTKSRSRMMGLLTTTLRGGEILSAFYC